MVKGQTKMFLLKTGQMTKSSLAQSMHFTSSSVLFKLCHSDVWILYLTEERLLLVSSSSVLFKLCHSDVWI